MHGGNIFIGDIGGGFKAIMLGSSKDVAGIRYHSIDGQPKKGFPSRAEALAFALAQFPTADAVTKYGTKAGNGQFLSSKKLAELKLQEVAVAGLERHFPTLNVPLADLTTAAQATPAPVQQPLPVAPTAPIGSTATPPPAAPKRTLIVDVLPGETNEQALERIKNGAVQPQPGVQVQVQQPAPAPQAPAPQAAKRSRKPAMTADGITGQPLPGPIPGAPVAAQAPASGVNTPPPAAPAPEQQIQATPGIALPLADLLKRRRAAVEAEAEARRLAAAAQQEAAGTVAALEAMLGKEGAAAVLAAL